MLNRFKPSTLLPYMSQFLIPDSTGRLRHSALRAAFTSRCNRKRYSRFRALLLFVAGLLIGWFSNGFIP